MHCWGDVAGFKSEGKIVRKGKVLARVDSGKENLGRLTTQVECAGQDLSAVFLLYCTRLRCFEVSE